MCIRDRDIDNWNERSCGCSHVCALLWFLRCKSLFIRLWAYLLCILKVFLHIWKCLRSHLLTSGLWAVLDVVLARRALSSCFFLEERSVSFIDNIFSLFFYKNLIMQFPANYFLHLFVNSYLSGGTQSLLVEATFWVIIYTIYAHVFSRLLPVSYTHLTLPTTILV